MKVTNPRPHSTEKPPKEKLTPKQWVKKHLLAIVLVVVAMVITGVFVVAITAVQFDSGSLSFQSKPNPKKYYSALTGVEVTDEASTKQPVTGVMIENSPDARPQSGLKEAGVVYEAVAEGGITRFMALYQGSKPALIGPVRSLRLYYLGWAAPYQASIAHVGGSPNALSEVRNGAYRDIDQFFNAGSYWRAADRYAPHNMYTSGERLDALNSSKGYAQSEFTSFKRADGKPAEKLAASSVTINFSSALYNTSYAYDKESNSYIRSLAGTAHTDREAGQIAPKVVVALEVGALARSGNSDGYEDLQTVGNGKAYVFQNGTVTEATWSRDNFRSELKLHDAEGKDIALNRGQTWVAAFTPGRGSIAWQ